MLRRMPIKSLSDAGGGSGSSAGVSIGAASVSLPCDTVVGRQSSGVGVLGGLRLMRADCLRASSSAG